MDKQMDYGYGYTECQGRGVRLWDWRPAVLGCLDCSVHASPLCSKVLLRRVWARSYMRTPEGLVTGTGTNKIVRAGCNRGKSWRRQNTFVCLFVLDLSHTMKNNCAETWRKAGWWRWKVFFLNTLKQSLLTLCSTPRPVHTVLTNTGFQRKPPKEAESCKFKEEKKSTVRRTGWKEC